MCVCVCVCVCVCARACAHTTVHKLRSKDNLGEVALLPSCGKSKEMNLGSWAWTQVPLPKEPSPWMVTEIYRRSVMVTILSLTVT